MAAMRVAQVSGLPCPRHLATLRNATWLALLVGCAHGAAHGKPGPDAAGAAQADAPPAMDDATPPGADAAPDAMAAAPDAAPDASMVASPDAPPDAGCAISAGVTPALGGADDLASYPAAQHLAPGAALGADGAAIAWDRTKLYVTVTSDAFEGAYEPLHVYVEAGTALAPAQPSTGKEYSGLVPQLPFTPTALVAVRRVTDSGTGPYDGVYLPGGGWTTRATPLAPGTDVFASADERTLSVAVPWSALGGCPTELRLAVHVVHAVAGNEWKELIPATHTPWQASATGYYDIDLTGAPDVSGWALK